MLDADVGFVRGLLDVFSFPGPKDYMLFLQPGMQANSTLLNKDLAIFLKVFFKLTDL